MLTKARRPARQGMFAAIFGVLAACLVLASPLLAQAFCRTRAVPDEIKAKFADDRAYEAGCVRDATGCCHDGPVVFWRSLCAGYSLQENASQYVPFEVASEVAARSFARWPAADCGSGAHPSISAKDLGSVACNEVGFNDAGANQNAIIFLDKKGPSSDPLRTIGLATVTYIISTGEIADVDIEINAADYRYVEGDSRQLPMTDLDAVLSHEAGHFYGLAHSQDSAALMLDGYERRGGISHELAPDDVRGICTIYPPDGRRAVDAPASPSLFVQASACNPTPRRGFTRECNAPAVRTDVPGNGCCAVAPGSGGGARGDSASAVLAALGGVAIWRLRRRRPRGG